MPDRPARQHSREMFTNADTVLSTAAGDTASVDAFGRARISEPFALFDSSFEYNLQPLFWATSLSGSGDITHDGDAHAATMTVSGSVAGTAILQTYDYHTYQKGKSQRSITTFVLGARASGITRRVGYFDASDGVFIEQTNAGLFLVLRSSTSGAVVDTRVAQADWSQNSLTGSGDKIGGANPITLDETCRQILDIDIEWLGVGRVRYGFNIDGKAVFAHYVNNANAGPAVPYMRSGTLPVRYEIVNDGTGAASELIAICAAVFSEGGFDEGRGLPFTANRGAVGASVAARMPVLSIRPKATFNSLENRGHIEPVDVHIMADTKAVLVELVYDALLFGTGSFGSVDANSLAEFNNSFTAISGGYSAQSFYVATSGTGNNTSGDTSSPILSKLPLTLDIAGANPIPLTIVCTPIGGTSTVYASMDWEEVY